MNSRERVKAIFKGQKPDKIVRGSIDFNFGVMKEILGDEYTGDEIKDKINFAKRLEIDILPMAVLRMGGGKIVGRFGIVDGRNIFKDGKGNYYEILQNYKIVKLRSKNIEDEKLPFNLCQRGGSLYHRDDRGDYHWVIPSIKNLKDIKKHTLIFLLGAKIFPLAKLFLKTKDFSLIKRAKQESDLFVMCGASSGFASLANHIFGGYEKFREFLDKHPEPIKKLIHAFIKLQSKFMLEIIKAGADGILICDDLASGDGPFVSPDIFREFFFDVMAGQVRAAKEKGMPVVWHSDGDIKDLIDDLLGNKTKTVEIISVDGKKRIITYRQLNLDGIECLERPYFSSDDLAQIKARYVYKVIWGNMYGVTLGAGDVEEVKKLTREIIQALKVGCCIAKRAFINDIIGESNVVTFSANPILREKQGRALEAFYQTVGEFSPEAKVKSERKMPLMIGSIFYKGDKLVADGKNGEFDETRAKIMLRELEELSQATGIPGAVDVVAETPEAMRKYVEFVAKNCSLPFLIGGTTQETRMAGARASQRVGALSRAIYSPINLDTKREEVEFLKNSGIKKALLLCANQDDLSPIGRLNAFKTLMSMVQEAKIGKIYVDTNLLDMGDLKPALEAVRLIKQNSKKVHSGFALANALSVLDNAQGKTLGPKIYSDLYRIVSKDSDFIFYGPIKLASVAYSALLVPSQPSSVEEILKAINLTRISRISLDEALSEIKEKGDLAYNFAVAVAKKEMDKMEALCQEVLQKYCYKDGQYLPCPEVLQLIDEGISAGMMAIFQQFAGKNIYLNDVLKAAEVRKKAIEILKPYMGQKSEKPKIVLGLISPNIQELGKKVVGIALDAGGFEVFDIGSSVLPEAFVGKAKELNADLIGISVYTTEGVDNAEKIIQLLKKNGVRDRVKVIIGGAATSSEVARRIGADAYGANAAEAVSVFRELMKR